jgi:hypothetical protein
MLLAALQVPTTWCLSIANMAIMHGFVDTLLLFGKLLFSVPGILSLCFNVSLTTALFFCVWGKKVFVALC